jgi:hypothetical protein
VTVLTLRRVRYQFIVTGPDIEPMTFKTRHEAREWCREHFRGSPIREEGPGGTTKRALTADCLPRYRLFCSGLTNAPQHSSPRSPPPQAPPNLE